MLITGLRKKRGKWILEFDNNALYEIDERVIIEYRLNVGSEINENEIEIILSQHDYYKTKDQAYRYLARRPHSEKELSDKLKRKQHSLENVDKVISDLIKINYLNDEDFAEIFINDRLDKKKGTLKIKAELFNRGVSRKIIEAASSKIDEEILLNNAVDLAEKKLRTFRDKEISEINQKQKIYYFLMNKGYSGDIIRKAISKIKNYQL
ncbi:MAG: recombination regulator RecX [Melioribacteraceae bacterium]|nr:recombination regulator RecX [Melioribacteraceae bacterium]MCF8352809.1 recombination regulator RecX [Melioribacteraceae bacterium]MCF8393471.1 recombination regulator RecX [Melioribacteraceae bacterium]MCF8417326.1 recombination regulator RecX [Melioribacteraceae bacterium]